jgi:glycosyltransferase involved in cell wall biosynthesis
MSLRVLMTSDTIGGVWTYALDLIEALAPHGDQVLLATLGKPLTSGQRCAVAAQPNVTLCESAFDLEWMDSPWEDVDRSGEWLMELAAAFAPDVVHLNTYSHAALPWSVPVLVAGHSCVYSWWHAVKGEAPPPAWRTYHRRVQAGLQEADLVVTPTRAMLDALIEHYGPLANTQVIYNGRSSRRFAAEANKEAMIMSAGRLWDEAKNIQILEQVASLLPWPIFIAGDQQHPSGKHVGFRCLHALGRLEADAVQLWLAKASIYVLPARYEPFGLSILEAALSRCAIVLGDIASLREVWGGAAIYVPPDDPIAIASALRNLASQDHQRLLMGSKARARAQEYTGKRMGDAYHQAYRRLTERSAIPEAVLQSY